MEQQRDLEELAAHVARAGRLAVLTGAGISAESGIPTFRDAQTGLWARWRPEDLATPQAFHGNPRLVWEWYRWRRALIEGVEPNAGHLALAEMERHCGNFHLATQNVDGLHLKAGSRRVAELHGNLFSDRCLQEDRLLDRVEEGADGLPVCPHCGGPARPGVVWFGEPLPAEPFRSATDAATECDVYLVVGTSGLVHPAAGLPALALRSGAFVAEVNPEPTPLTESVHLSLRARAGTLLPALLEAMS